METYRVKNISRNNEIIKIITQNKNGPCPIIAICNVLSLRKQIEIPDKPQVHYDQLAQILADFILNKKLPNNANEQLFQQTVTDALETIPFLVSGLDVNVQFKAIDKFEFTKAISLFDVCNIK
jgi:hypothetical protein